MSLMNPREQLKSILFSLSENNEAEQEAISKYYELLRSVRDCREMCASKWDDDKEQRVTIKIPADVEKILNDIESMAKEHIADEKRHSLDLNVAQQSIDGIAPALT